MQQLQNKLQTIPQYQNVSDILTTVFKKRLLSQNSIVYTKIYLQIISLKKHVAILNYIFHAFEGHFYRHLIDIFLFLTRLFLFLFLKKNLLFWKNFNEQI